MQELVRTVALGSSPDGLAKTAVRVKFSKDNYNRKSDPEMERLIETTWSARFKENPLIFNGSKFRLAKLVEEASGVDTASLSYCLHMGLTDYRDFLGTNCCENIEEWQRRGEQLHNNRQAFMSDALGVGALVVTADNQVVFLRRSQLCSEARGLLDRPGGHAEPEMVSRINEDNTSETDNLADSIRDELFDSILREVVDEVNIPKGDLEQPRIYGIVENLTTGARPSAEFIIKCSLTAPDIRKLFQLGSQKEAEESTGIHFESVEDLRQIKTKNSIRMEEFAPAAQGSINLYADLFSLAQGKLTN